MPEVKNTENKVPTHISPLHMLLNADRGKVTFVPKKQIEITRLSEAVGASFIVTVRAMTLAEYNDAQDMAVSISGKGELEEVSGSTLQAVVVMYGMIDPNPKEKELLEYFEALTPKELMTDSKFLLPGEISQLYSEISELSGFGNDAIKEIKNA